MKGYFSLRYCQCTEEIHFGKLREDIGLLGYMREAVHEDSRMPTLIAHDVVEHAVSHRTKTYVTYEDELRAVGATGFVRCDQAFDMYQEVLNQVEPAHRDIKPVPYIVGKFLLDDCWVSSDMMRYLIKNNIEPKNARNAAYQYSWGEFQKQSQFNFCDYTARTAFKFIEDNVSAALQALDWEEEYCTGITVYFDTVKQIFRFQFKRQ